ncbi:MAG: hypothetical protein DSZ00_09735 [Gammaproteobacteria bacterium]|nr:MAG: hypothetical protein DSZ00_09735 [Gammaproteobacteria bacterium]
MPFRSLIPFLLLLLLLAGCEGLPKKPAADSDPQARHAAALFEKGQYDAAAELYQGLAGRAAPQIRPIYELLAADSLLHAGHDDKAAEMLQKIDPKQLPPGLANRYHLVEAELALAAGDSERAAALLGAIHTADRATRIRAETLRARAQKADGDRLGEARTLIRLDQLLQDEEKRLQVQLRILDLLSRLPDEELREKLGNDEVSRGWRELASLVRGHPNDPQGVAAPWREWQALYPRHPALPFLLVLYYEEQRKLAPTRVERIAVLLPASGRYAGVADAIRDGLLSAWYADSSEQRPRITFYDSSDPEQLWPLLNRAAEEGADVAIGPLAKQGVLQLARAGELPLPVLALNRVTTDTVPPANLYQYSLSPEDEARQAAIWAASRGLGMPGVLYPDSARGERLFRAFETLWMTLGRAPVRAEVYRPAQNDFSEPVERLLNMKEAKAEHARREKEAGKKLPFKPELPVDFVFIPGSKSDLLQLRPLLMFHHGSSLPVLSLSRIWKGTLERDEAFDLSGILLPEIPWLVEEQADSDPLSRENMARLFPREFRKYPRLIAMGMDAYALLPNLSRLSVPGQEPLAGRTGELSLDGRRVVQRRLTWVSLGLEPRILGLTPPLESIDTSGWEPVDSDSDSSLSPDEASPPEQR